MVIKRFSQMVKVARRNTPPPPPDESSFESDTPEVNVKRGIQQFCESISSEPGDEVLHLPVIVEAAESSPGAASAAAHQIRKYLSKDNFARPQVQYNAVMLIRILADNPGPSFTKNLDAKFAATVKTLLRENRDQSVQQITRETLSALYMEKAYDTNLNVLFTMWTKEQPGQIRPRQMNAPAFSAQEPTQQQPPPPIGFGAPSGPQRDHFAGGNRAQPGGIPSPVELAARVEEAKTSAKLLQQLVQSTPPSEVQGNDLIKEFGQRVSAAQQSIQGYINSDNPPPDEDTLQTLIETSEQLSLAASKHQRAVLQSRRLVGNQGTPPTQGNPEQYFPGDNRQRTAASAPHANTVPILQAPALPARRSSNGVSLTHSQQPSQPAQQRDGQHDDLYDSYEPPTGPPPGRTPANSSPQSPQSLYAAPPMPSATKQANLGRRTTAQDVPPRRNSQAEGPSAPPNLPPLKINSDPIELDPSTPPPRGSAEPGPPPAKQARNEDPFSDHHASPESAQDTLAMAPPSHPSTDPLATQARRAAADDPRDGSRPTGSAQSYHPGYQSTPSYLHRQHSAGNKLVMHGGTEQPRGAGEAQQ